MLKRITYLIKALKFTKNQRQITPSPRLERVQKEMGVQTIQDLSLTQPQERVQKEIVNQVIPALSRLFLRDQSLENLETHSLLKDICQVVRVLNDKFNSNYLV